MNAPRKRRRARFARSMEPTIEHSMEPTIEHSMQRSLRRSMGPAMRHAMQPSNGHHIGTCDATLRCLNWARSWATGHNYISASPTACRLRGCGRAGTQNDRLSPRRSFWVPASPYPRNGHAVGDTEMPVIRCHLCIAPPVSECLNGRDRPTQKKMVLNLCGCRGPVQKGFVAIDARERLLLQN